MKQDDKILKETKDALLSIINFLNLLLSDLHGKNPDKRNHQSCRLEHYPFSVAGSNSIHISIIAFCFKSKIDGKVAA